MADDLTKLEDENKQLKEQIKRLEERNEQESVRLEKESKDNELELDEYLRYGRQLLVPEIGIRGQLKLKHARVLVVGAGGLGSPALAYLAGAGIGILGIVDGDIVAESNLHRQIIHDTTKLEQSKCESAESFISRLNPYVKVISYKEHLSCINSFEIFSDYDLVLDCTDNPATRYLINDTAVIVGIPLISASALKTEGQLSILNFHGGPCYRCLFPIPPPPDSILSCGDGGIIGPVVGIMGVMQAIEAIKLLTGAYDTNFTPSLTIFSAYSAPPWRYIRMRGRKPACDACGDVPTITTDAIQSGKYSYSAFCGHATMVQAKPEDRVSALEYSRVSDKHTLVDVRDTNQFDICSLANSINIPLSELKEGKLGDKSRLVEPIYVVCRYGNDSQESIGLLREHLGARSVKDIVGGLHSWATTVNSDFPIY